MSYVIDTIYDFRKQTKIVRDCFAILGGSLFCALMAQISIYLWFTPIPLSMESLAVLMVGACLGAKRGSLAIIAYLIEGALGLPFFAVASSGLAVLLGPKGGYLIAFIFAAFFVGYQKNRKGGYFLKLAIFSLASLMILFFGAFWLSFFVGWKQALIMGVYPFLIGDGLKALALSLIKNESVK